MAEGYIPIPRIVVGEESLVSASRANKLIDAVNALMGAKIAPIANVGKMMASGGHVIYDFQVFDSRLKALEAGGGIGGNTNANSLPFGICNTSPNANFASVNVRFAAVGNIVPNGIGADINLSMPNSDTNIYLNITIDNNATVTAASINTGSVPSDNATKAYKLIGNVHVVSNVVTIINQALLFSQTFVACGRNTTDPATTPGTYYWQVS